MEQTVMPGSRYPHLFTPLRIGNLRLKNRVIAAPTSPSMVTAQGHMTPEMLPTWKKKPRAALRW